MEPDTAVRALAALGERHRLKIFRLLVTAGPKGLAAGEIAQAAEIAPTNLTFHMKELERAGLTRSWRAGRFVRSAVNVETMRALVTFLTEDCCGGRPELCGRDIIDLDAACEACEGDTP